MNLPLLTLSLYVWTAHFIYKIKEVSNKNVNLFAFMPWFCNVSFMESHKMSSSSIYLTYSILLFDRIPQKYAQKAPGIYKSMISWFADKVEEKQQQQQKFLTN